VASEARDEYIVALHALSKVSPDAWATFVEAFKVYTAYELEKITTAAPEHAPIAVGFGRKMKELRDDIVGIEQLAQKIKR
jgi:hypothetical protein